MQRTKSCFVARPSTPRFLKAGEITSASDSGIPTVEHPLSERPSDKVLQRTKSAATEKISPRRREEILCDSSCLRGEQDACAPGFKCLNPPHVRCLPVWSSATTELLSLRGSWRVSVRPKATRRLGFQIGQRTLRVSPLKSCPRSRCIL